MCVNWRIAGGACKILIISIGDMCLVILKVVSFGESEVYHIDFILIGSSADEEIIRFDIAMKHTPLMDELDSFEQF